MITTPENIKSIINKKKEDILCIFEREASKSKI